MSTQINTHNDTTRSARAMFVLHSWIEDMLLLAAFVAFLGSFRLLMIGLFSGQIKDSVTTGSILSALHYGLKFDISTAMKWILLTMLLALVFAFAKPAFRLWLTSVRLTVARLFFFLVTLLLVIDAGYFYTYGDHFNQLIFGVIYDDPKAVLITVWKEYHPLWLLAFSLLVSFVSMFAVRKWLALARPIQQYAQQSIRATPLQVLLIIPMFFLFVFLGRGMELNGPPVSMKHAYVTHDMILNRMIPNPLLALWQTVKTRIRIDNDKGLDYYWPSGDMQEAIRVAFSERQKISDARPVAKISDALQVSAVGSAKTAPKHIFIVLLESHSGWTVFPEYRQFGFSPELSALAEKGHYLRAFLPASTGTIGAINTLVAGLPDSGLYVNYEARAQTPLRTSVAEIFKRLGYKTRFFYGGLLGWQRLDQFAAAQGFEEVYGGGDIGEVDSFNEWGVDDKYLFKFVEDTVLDGPKSLNFIMTTTNHPPYDIDLEAEGYPLRELPQGIQGTFSNTMRVLGHLWYADKQLGQFVHSAEQKADGLLFAITGDHTARLRLSFPGSNVLEQVAVPLVFYGDALDTGRKGFGRKAAAHIDVVPTLVEAVAPRGFIYHAYGNNLYAYANESFGMGVKHIVTDSSFIEVSNPDRAYPINGVNLDTMQSTIGDLLSRHKAYRALSWFRMKVGDELPVAAVNPLAHQTQGAKTMGIP